MVSIPIANTDPQVSQLIKKILKEEFSNWEPLFFENPSDFLEFVLYENPDIFIINFADEVYTLDVLHQINHDPWLNCSCIIAIYKGKESEFIDQIKTQNVLAVIPHDEVSQKFQSVLKIIEKEQNLLFQRDFQSALTGEIIGTFSIENDLLCADVYNNLIVNYLYNLNLIDKSKKLNLKLVLQELLVNAIEHGNCGITFDEKTRLTFDEGLFGDEIVQLKISEDPTIINKRVRLDYTITNEQSKIAITDEGEGFDWKNKIHSSIAMEDPTQMLHGRGIIISQTHCQELVYNQKGNQVQFTFEHCANLESKVPALFDPESKTHFKVGDTVFKINENSNYLFYIASGKYQIINSAGIEIAIVTPNDIFIGDMAFLLNNKRTATVKAVEDGILYKIPKKKFIAAIKKYPYYSYFLCKILARRLSDGLLASNTS